MGKKLEEVCEHGRMHQGPIRPTQKVRFDLWYTDGAKVDLNCYAWCTRDGKLPNKKKDDDTIGTEIIKRVVIAEYEKHFYFLNYSAVN